MGIVNFGEEITTSVEEPIAHSENPFDQETSPKSLDEKSPFNSSAIGIMELDDDPRVVPFQENFEDSVATILEPSSAEEITPKSLEDLIGEVEMTVLDFQLNLRMIFLTKIS